MAEVRCCFWTTNSSCIAPDQMVLMWKQ